MDVETLKAAYRKVPLDELWKIVGVVEDALMRWESRAAEEPCLRIRIRQGYESLSIVQQAIAERVEEMNEDELLH
jgi:hypothetical protein